MNKPKSRHWALNSQGAEAGKTTFTASNARPPLMVVDSDNRFDAVEGLALGEVRYPTQVFNTAALAEELMASYAGNPYASLSWDSLTKLYSIHTRLPYMQARSGQIKNKASAMIEKSNVMTIARDIGPVLGVDAYYVWHTTSGVDGMGKMEVRDMISATEKARLETSISVTLEFSRVNGVYQVRVASARDFGGRPANTGFTLIDKPGNYWRGAADRLEELMYAYFAKTSESVDWALQQLGQGHHDELLAEYERLKVEVRPEKASHMWIEWMIHIWDLIDERDRRQAEKPTEVATDDEGPADEPIIEQPAPDGAPDLPEAPPPVEDEGPPPDLPEDEGPLPEIDAEAFEVEAMRLTLGTKDKLAVGHVVHAIAAVPTSIFFGRADLVFVKLEEYPDGFPDGFTLALDQRISVEGGQKLFDWLMGQTELPELNSA